MSSVTKRQINLRVLPAVLAKVDKPGSLATLVVRNPRITWSAMAHPPRPSAPIARAGRRRENWRPTWRWRSGRRSDRTDLNGSVGGVSGKVSVIFGRW